VANNVANAGLLLKNSGIVWRELIAEFNVIKSFFDPSSWQLANEFFSSIISDIIIKIIK
jgi:hypothetical protein